MSQDEISMFATEDFNKAKLLDSTKELIKKLDEVGLKVKIEPGTDHNYATGVYIELLGTLEYGWINDELTLQSQLNHYYDNKERYLSEELAKK